MACPPSIIYGCIACITVLVAVFMSYKNQNNSFLGSVLNITGVGKISKIQLVCSLICGVFGILCVMSLLNIACDENMIIGWTFGCLCIASQFFGLYQIWKKNQ